MHILFSLWEFMISLNADGMEDKFKACLVVKGNDQEEDI